MVNITEKEFRLLADYIKANYGINLKEEKKALVLGRLQNVLIQTGHDNFTDYYNYILKDESGEAATTLVNRITTNHTYFMRENDHFYFFRDRVLPFFTDKVKDKDLRIWCAACSSGEEAYTLAMILDEYFGNDKKWWDTKVLATDISENVLEIAKNGIYSNDKVAALPPNWKLSYFKKIDSENAAVCEKIKKEVIYRKLNLMDETFPFKKKFHAIFCRNVMIYFDNETKTRLIDKFYDCLGYGGYLFIGHSESINRESTRFKYIMPAVYRKE